MNILNKAVLTSVKVDNKAVLTSVKVGNKAVLTSVKVDNIKKREILSFSLFI
jgi:hypothetical protein